MLLKSDQQKMDAKAVENKGRANAFQLQAKKFEYL
jgi:hypothetical protein